MRTRDVLRWNQSARDLVNLALLALGGAVLVVVTKACDRIETTIDARAARRWHE